MTLNAIETVLLAMLPFSFAAKTLALGFMWWHLRFRTSTTGPLGERINISFGATTIMSMFLTWLAYILYVDVDANEINWPMTTLALIGLAVWPWVTAWTHARVYLGYRRIAHGNAPRGAGGPLV